MDELTVVNPMQDLARECVDLLREAVKQNQIALDNQRAWRHEHACSALIEEIRQQLISFSGENLGKGMEPDAAVRAAFKSVAAHLHIEDLLKDVAALTNDIQSAAAQANAPTEGAK
jgi:hypothetical protein